MLRDAFTHGPTGPGPRGPLKFLDLGGPEQNFEKPVNYKPPYKLTLQPQGRNFHKNFEGANFQRNLANLSYRNDLR